MVMIEGVPLVGLGSWSILWLTYLMIEVQSSELKVLLKAKMIKFHIRGGVRIWVSFL